MITGKSLLHVTQNLGKQFEPTYLKGYFNDLTEKVLKQQEFVDHLSIPTVKTEKGLIVFPVAVFQYALACYDLYLSTNETKYLDEFKLLANWTLSNQLDKGQYNNFENEIEQRRYSAMAQGEATSVLVRAYTLTQDKKYIFAAKKAIAFMITDIKDGGVSSKGDQGLILYEYVDQPPVLNGWIFASYGLRDIFLATGDNYYQDLFLDSLNEIKYMMPQYDLGYWSKYDCAKKIASPFYHNLHIAQLQALFLTTGDEIFKNYEEKFKKSQKKLPCKTRAFIKKVFQKIVE